MSSVKNLFYLLFTCMYWFAPLSVMSQKKQPNIVIIISDDHAFQAISAYGNQLVNTPNIDRLAKEGMLFNKAYVTNSLCGPSRATLLTGKYSHKNGFKDNRSTFDGDQNTFIKELRSAGYQTAWIGKWHLVSQPQGFDFWQILPGQGSYYNPDFLMMDGNRKKIEGYVSNVVEDLSEEWLDKRDNSRPFCLVIGHKATHRTWIPDIEDMGRFDNVQFPLPANFYDEYKNREAAKVQDMTVDKTMRMDNDLKMFPDTIKDASIKRMNSDQRAKFDAYYKPIMTDLKAHNLKGRALVEWKYQRYMRDYFSTGASLDRNIGRTLNYLDKHNLTDNTIVIYLSDQGFYLGEHGWFDKRFMYEESFRTPMVMRYPGVIKPGSVSNHFIMNLDIAPTMLDVAGLPISSVYQGQSILPLLTEKNAKGRGAMYYHYYEDGEHSVSPHFGVKDERYKLIRFYKKVSSWELFDLKNDPKEMNNLYGKKEYEKITATLKAQLKALIIKYEDAEAENLFSLDTSGL